MCCMLSGCPLHLTNWTLRAYSPYRLMLFTCFSILMPLDWYLTILIWVGIALFLLSVAPCRIQRCLSAGFIDRCLPYFEASAGGQIKCGVSGGHLAQVIHPPNQLDSCACRICGQGERTDSETEPANEQNELKY